MSRKTQTSVAAELTRWAIERSDYLKRENLPMKVILTTFERDTGQRTTYYTAKKVFETLEIPIGRSPRKISDSRLDRLINEVVTLSERLHLLSVTMRKQVVPSTTDYELTPELKALRNRHAPPEDAGE
jgi:hypothetical protein